MEYNPSIGIRLRRTVLFSFLFIFSFLNTSSAFYLGVEQSPFKNDSNALIYSIQEELESPKSLPLENEKQEKEFEEVEDQDESKKIGEGEVNRYFDIQYNAIVSLRIKAMQCAHSGYMRIPLFILHHSWRSYLI